MFVAVGDGVGASRRTPTACACPLGGTLQSRQLPLPVTLPVLSLSLPALPFPSPATCADPLPGIAIGLLAVRGAAPVALPPFGPSELGAAVVVPAADGIQRVYAGLAGRALPGRTPAAAVAATCGESGRAALLWCALTERVCG